MDSSGILDHDQLRARALFEANGTITPDFVPEGEAEFSAALTSWEWRISFDSAAKMLPLTRRQVFRRLKSYR